MRTSASRPVFTALRKRIQRLEGGAARSRTVLPFGIQAIDQHLPDGGLALGALHEIAGRGNGAVDGAAAALFTAGIAARTRGQVLWCVTRQDLFAPAIAQAGLLPDLIYVEADNETSVLASVEEGLRHGGLGAVIAEVSRLSTRRCASRHGEYSLSPDNFGAKEQVIGNPQHFAFWPLPITLRSSATKSDPRGDVVEILPETRALLYMVAA
jgi:hypothetical protein